MNALYPPLLCLSLFLLGMVAPAPAKEMQEITQHGITWTFDQPRQTGRFVTGDYWVIGPVEITAVSPTPGPQPADETSATAQSRYGAVAMRADPQMRNGSMIVLKPGPSQGYDSRLKNYRPELSIAFPYALQPGQSLISTISNKTFPVPVLHEALMWSSEKKQPLALRSAAVLTCLAEAPPDDAFRPPYAGSKKPIYELKDLRWDLLPTLAPPAKVPSWEQFERYLERPWLDHIDNWMLQYTGPNENQVNYGREFSRITSIASLMLMLDVPPERKEKLMIGLVQLGLDLHGLAQAGRQWTADGGHWNGRKWPMLFAGLMLDKKELQTLPTTLFSEDQQTYFGHGWAGQTALFQMAFHTGPHEPYEEKSPATWNAEDKRSESYRITVSGGLPGTALAAQLMNAKALWNHDAFFDYYDRWMNPHDPSAEKRGNVPRPSQEGRALDPFVNAMWANSRQNLPAQPGGAANLKWTWSDNKKGQFVPNQPTKNSDQTKP